MDVFFSNGRGSPEPLLISMKLFMSTTAWSLLTSEEHLLFYHTP